MAVVDAIERSEARLRQGAVDGVALVVGRKAAEELAADVYRSPPPAQRLTPYEMSLLDRAGRRGK